VPAAAWVAGKTTMMKKYTYFVDHSDDRGSVPVQYRTHCLMEEIHGFPRSHGMPQWGEYLLQ
jgi:hypothetical protein